MKEGRALLIRAHPTPMEGVYFFITHMKTFIAIGPLLIFIAAVLWGFDGILRRSLYSLPPITIVFFEHLIGLIILSPFLIKLWVSEKLSSREWGVITLIALLSGVLGTLFFTSALLAVSFIPFSVVFLVQKLQPIFAVTSAALFLRERITKHFIVWAVIALVAGYFVTFPNGIVNFGEGGGYVLAALYALLAAIAWGSSTAFSRSLLIQHSNTFITGLRFLLTVPIALVFLLFMGSTESLHAISLEQLGILVLIAVSTGMLALWIYYKGLSKTRASIASIIELAFPMTAVFIDYFLYGTTLEITQYLAAAVLLFAAYKVATLKQEVPQT